MCQSSSDFTSATSLRDINEPSVESCETKVLQHDPGNFGTLTLRPSSIGGGWDLCPLKSESSELQILH